MAVSDSSDLSVKNGHSLLLLDRSARAERNSRACFDLDHWLPAELHPEAGKGYSSLVLRHAKGGLELAAHALEHTVERKKQANYAYFIVLFDSVITRWWHSRLTGRSLSNNQSSTFRS